MSGNAAQQRPSYEELEAGFARLAAQNAELTAHIHALSAQIRSLKEIAFGKKSERFVPDTQISLFPLPEIKEDELPKTVIAEHERSKRPGRKPLPANLPRTREEYEPEERHCRGCSEEMPRIGEEITEELEYSPATFKVIEHVKIKRACPHEAVTGSVYEARAFSSSSYKLPRISGDNLSGKIIDNWFMTISHP